MSVDVLAGQLLDTALDELDCEYDAECNLLITTPGCIRTMNREKRDIDSETDVLSFPMIEFGQPCDYGCLDEDDYSQFNPDSGRLMLGDIVICYNRVITQANEYGHSVKRELSFLIVHSILHLFGYDHMTDNERTVMEDMQRRILDKLGIRR